MKPNSPDNSSSATSQSQQSPAIDLTGSSPKSQPSSSASQSSKPPLDKQKPKPKQREDDLFTGRTIKKLNINDLNGTGPFAPPKQKQNLQVSPPKPFKPAPIFAPTNPPLSPVKTANMRIMDDRYETSTASKDSGKLAKDMLKSQYVSHLVNSTLYGTHMSQCQFG